MGQEHPRREDRRLSSQKPQEGCEIRNRARSMNQNPRGPNWRRNRARNLQPTSIFRGLRSCRRAKRLWSAERGRREGTGKGGNRWRREMSFALGSRIAKIPFRTVYIYEPKLGRAAYLFRSGLGRAVAGTSWDGIFLEP